MGSGVAGGARGWVAGRAGLWGVPPTWVWVVGLHLMGYCPVARKGYGSNC